MDIEKSTRYNEEISAAAQRIRTEAFIASQSPRPYASGSISTLNILPTGSREDLISMEDDPILNSSFPDESGDLAVNTVETPTVEPSPPRPIDAAEVAANNPPLISNLTKQVFDKNKFKETVDVTFSQLGVENQVDPSFFDVSLATLEDFWILYDQFFYDIPKEGDTNSHAYLARTSGEYANYEFIQEQIQELLDEIAEIRMENVDLRIENVNITVANSTPASSLPDTTLQDSPKN